jgi:hypothetical protein
VLFGVIHQLLVAVTSLFKGIGRQQNNRKIKDYFGKSAGRDDA